MCFLGGAGQRQRKAVHFASSILPFLIYPFIFVGCIWNSWSEFQQSLKDWQKKQMQRRYGSAYIDKEKIPKWQEEIKKYEKVIDEKIKASSHLAQIHRKLGESFAEMASYQKCIQHLEEAIQLGAHNADVFYKRALCKGSLAQKNNWSYPLTKQAEESFLALLNLDPNYEKAKLQLGLIYFYGFGKNSRYRVLDDYITITQKQYREKALNLLLRYKNKAPDDHRVYFALTNIYKIIGKTSSARTQMQDLINMLKKKHPENYQEIKEYRSALQNLSLLSSYK